MRHTVTLLDRASGDALRTYFVIVTCPTLNVVVVFFVLVVGGALQHYGDLSVLGSMLVALELPLAPLTAVYFWRHHRAHRAWRKQFTSRR